MYLKCNFGGILVQSGQLDGFFPQFLFPNLVLANSHPPSSSPFIQQLPTMEGEG